MCCICANHMLHEMIYSAVESLCKVVRIEPEVIREYY